MEHRRAGAPFMMTALALSLILAVSCTTAQPLAAKLHVHFINVGQADATLIMDDARKCVILIDSGDTRYPGSSKNFRTYLQQHLPTDVEINLAIVSHPHNDHLGSMQWVLKTYRVKAFIDNGEKYASKIYDNLMTAVHQQKQQQRLQYYTHDRVPASVETVCGAGGPRLHILYPQAGFDDDTCAENANNCSVVAKLTLGQTSFLFPGDAEEEQEEILLKDAKIKADLRSTVLKVPHHGSDTSSSQDFLDAVKPAVMVISAGEKDTGTNKGYKHPRLSTVQRLLGFVGPKANPELIDVYDADKKTWTQTPIWGRLYVTAKDGTVVLSTDGTTIRKE